MRTRNADDLVSEYLGELGDALGRLPRRRRRQLVDEIAQHIAEARTELADQEPATVAALLDSVGDPADIAAEALGGLPLPPNPSGSAEDWAIGLLLFGGFAFVVGWFVGVFLLWNSTVWRLRDKILGTLLVPGGLAGSFILLGVAGTTVHGTTTTNGVVCSGPALVAPSVGSSLTGPTLTKSVHATCHTLNATSSAGPQVFAIVVLVLLVLIPILIAIYLNKRRRYLMLA